MSLGLYKFKKHNGTPLLSDFFFVPLYSIKGNNQKFVKDVNGILTGNRRRDLLDADSFYSMFLNGQIGTTDRDKIEKYFYENKELPSFELRLYFEDDGKKLISLIQGTSTLEQEKIIQAKVSRD